MTSKFLDDKGLEQSSAYDFNALEEMDPSLGIFYNFIFPKMN